MSAERRRYAPLARSWVAAYGFAIGIGLFSVIVSRLVEYKPGSEPVYAALVGAVAISVWYGGAGAGLVTLAIGWSLAPFVLYPDQTFSFGDSDDLDRWGLSLVAALAVVWVSLVMRRGQSRAATAVEVAERSGEQMKRLQELSAGLSNAVSVAEVAHVITEPATAALGAQGAALGLIQGEELEIVDPSGLAAQALAPGSRLALDKHTLLTRSAREGVVVRLDERASLASSFPDSALLLPPSVGAVVAVPLRAMGEVVGVVGFLFERNSLGDETVTAAQTIAGLAEQALERARLYELERERRQTLDRILRVAPHFHAETVQEVTAVICREARVTFGGDFGVLWQLRDSRLVLLNSDPVREEMPRGLEVPLEDFSGLAVAVANHDVSFSPDVLLEARGIGLERYRRIGMRSSLRSPIVIGGRAELVLAVSWQTVVSEPERSAVVLMRRFADQAGLAVEQLERRRAEAEAARRAEDAVRLQEATAALSLAATPGEVAETGLDHALSVCGDAGFVVLTSPHEGVLDFAASRGFGDREFDTWRAFGLDADVPFARAIATGEPVWALNGDEMGAFTQAGEFDDAGWAALPLKRGAIVQGALHLTLRRPTEVSEGGRSWLESVAAQCALALERSRLLEEEKLRRVRSERLQSMTEALSNALTQKDVAELVVEVLCDELDPEAASISSLVEDRATLRALAWRGYPDELADDEVSLDADTPETRAARGRGWRLYTSEDDDPVRSAKGPVSYVVAPLVAGRRRIGVLAASWNTPTTLGREDRAFVENMAGQAALALDRARVFESERATAETLQRSVLPASLPLIEGVQLAARYLPGTQGVAVGGDWFDALELHDGRLGLVVGDVMGKGVQAAASMGQLRNALRAFSVERLKPSSALARLDRLGDETLDAAFATVVYAVLDSRNGVVRFSSAGHPPPVVAYADGRVELLEEGRGLPLGTGMRPQYRQAVAELPAGSVLVLYSDGLVERRGQSIDDGLERLVDAVRHASKDPEHLLEHVLDRVVGDAPRADDIALLAARLLPVAPQPLELRLPTTIDGLYVVRDALRMWTRGAPLGRPESESLVLAAWEASANAIEHATGHADLMVVRAMLKDSTIRVTVEDGGRWVPPSSRPGRGFGLQLMRSLASSVEIVPGEDGRGTRVTIEYAAGVDAPLRTAR